ncbi:hypothetical protein GOV04_05160 [Candidatus Woesearchaeota archaeon]|nr:hypothetical protein [Candidatus Woesearchaeota archaeon]
MHKASLAEDPELRTYSTLIDCVIPEPIDVDLDQDPSSYNPDYNLEPEDIVSVDTLYVTSELAKPAEYGIQLAHIPEFEDLPGYTEELIEAARKIVAQNPELEQRIKTHHIRNSTIDLFFTQYNNKRCLLPSKLRVRSYWYRY